MKFWPAMFLVNLLYTFSTPNTKTRKRIMEPYWILPADSSVGQEKVGGV